MFSVLLDTYVLLDYLLCRVPCAQDARDILAACRDGRGKRVYGCTFPVEYVLYPSEDLQHGGKAVTAASIFTWPERAGAIPAVPARGKRGI